MNWLESKNCALNVAVMLMQRLKEPRGVGCLGGKPPYWVHGFWELRAHEMNQRARVPLQFAIQTDWMSRPPLSRSRADFIRRETNWHCSKEGWLCIGLPDEWKDTLADETKADGDAKRLMDIAVTWALASTDSLVSRHLYAARYGIDAWPDEWDQWAHFEAGREEYRRQQAQHLQAKS
jgi:hypothetical protein